MDIELIVVILCRYNGEHFILLRLMGAVLGNRLLYDFPHIFSLLRWLWALLLYTVYSSRFFVKLDQSLTRGVFYLEGTWSFADADTVFLGQLDEKSPSFGGNWVIMVSFLFFWGYLSLFHVQYFLDPLLYWFCLINYVNFLVFNRSFSVKCWIYRPKIKKKHLKRSEIKNLLVLISFHKLFKFDYYDRKLVLRHHFLGSLMCAKIHPLKKGSIFETKI